MFGHLLLFFYFNAIKYCTASEKYENILRFCHQIMRVRQAMNDFSRKYVFFKVIFIYIYVIEI